MAHRHERPGATAAEAAGAIGRTVRFLTERARSDGELRAAFAEEPFEAQKRARKTDYLAILLRTSNMTAAAAELGAPMLVS
ncbi:hypothetical protein ACH4OX_32695 [Streptomyces roseolus]|uniref:hypothetical protein n=1 Tax=Streptomyces roseolus TaxID=67358 RepID=UPI00379EB0BC